MSDKLQRRSFISKIGLALSTAIITPWSNFASNFKEIDKNTSPILDKKALGFQWDTLDPFLFCVHHEDEFPKGNEVMGPNKELFKGRHMGDDFIIKDGFRMYHGKTVPGFPGHPHRGFETITVVRKGIVDHADSMGASGRYGNGDVQWMTAGKGVQHSEMFPLVHQDKDNTMELFQIWLNLPKKDKMIEPHFKMLWREAIPNHAYTDNNGKKTNVEVIAGQLENEKAPTPPPGSWATEEANQVAIWNIKMEAGATWTLPKTAEGVNRMLYFYEGTALTLAGENIKPYTAVQLIPTMDVALMAGGGEEVSILVLQGKPIGEPVIQYGPFVMNTKEEIKQAFDDYHATEFGGWPWPKYDQVHPRNKSRFAHHADGKEEVF